MKFDHEIAQKIIDEHGLSPNTLKVWKSRGEIPDRYLSGYQKPTELPAHLLPAQDHIRKVFALGIFNKNELSSNPAHFYHAVKGKISLSLEDIKGYKLAADSLALACNKASAMYDARHYERFEKLAKSVFGSDALYLSNTLGEAYSQAEYKQVLDWVNDKRTFPSELSHKLKKTLDELKVILSFSYEV